MGKSLLHWKTAEAWLEKAKAKDPGLTKALQSLAGLQRDDEYEKRIAFLTDIAKHATALAKMKEIVALGPKALQLFKDCAEAAVEARKRAETEKREADKSGLHSVKLQIIVNNWNNKPLGSGYSGYVEFRSPGVDVVRGADVLSGNGLDINDMRLRPTGTVYLIIRRRGETKDVYCEGTTAYKFEAGKPNTVMIFKFVQNNKVIKLRAKTVDEVTEKLGVKGSVGLEFKVLTVGGEVSKESEYKHGFEQEVEWEVDYGIDSFKFFEQT